MTAQAPAVEAAALSIKPRPDGGFVLSDPLTGARRSAARTGRAIRSGGRVEAVLRCVAAIIGEMRHAGGGAAKIEPAHVAIALDAVEAQVLEPRGRAVVV